MWVNHTLPVLRENPGFGALLSLGLIAAAVALQLALPALPPLITLFPAVLLSALVGGKIGGGIALLIGAVAGYALLHRPAVEASELWSSISLLVFFLEGLMIIFVILLLDTAVARLQYERKKLNTVLRAAGASTWEMHPEGTLTWDRNFYRIVGLVSDTVPPSTERFLSMVHPDDRTRMAEARNAMDKGLKPKEKDEYRLKRPVGETIWLENHRVLLDERPPHYLGIAQDITSRKLAEQQITVLLHELAHCAKKPVCGHHSNGPRDIQSVEERRGVRRSLPCTDDQPCEITGLAGARRRPRRRIAHASDLPHRSLRCFGQV